MLQCRARNHRSKDGSETPGGESYDSKQLLWHARRKRTTADLSSTARQSCRVERLCRVPKADCTLFGRFQRIKQSSCFPGTVLRGRSIDEDG
jgi:hypothetical protein